MFSSISKGKSGVCRGDQEKVMLNFDESSFLTLEFQRGVTQLYGIFKVKESFVLSRISKGKVTNLKNPEFFFKKVCPQPLFGFFRNNQTIISYIIVIVQILTNW